MIRAHFGLERDPFSRENLALLPHQKDVLDTLRVHCHQGGFCVLIGEPGTGKSVLKDALVHLDKKRLHVPVVGRTMHTYHSTLRILCEAFALETKGRTTVCERRLIDEAHAIHQRGHMLAPLIDDAHLLDIDSMRRLRLLFDDFPISHNLVLVAQPPLLQKLALTTNDDIRSRITYSVRLRKLAPDDMRDFLLAELDRAAMAHSVFDDDALALIVRSSDGLLRRARNLALSSLHEAVRDRIRTVGLPQVNRVLLQPHWQAMRDLDTGSIF
jgi:MSHA biogenesis protein MshM